MTPTIPRHRVDPTGTATIRKRYAQKLRGGFADLNTSIRQGVIEDDVFGLDIDFDTLSEAPPSDFRFLSDSRKQERFDEWVDGAVEDDVLSKIDRDNNTYIKSAYSRGLQDAKKALRESGADVPEEDLEAVINQGVHQNALENLYSRNFSNLEGITAAMGAEISEELAVGFAQGENPREIARRITDRVDKIGMHRATVLARTEIVNAYSEATLNRFERMSVGSVTIQAEWLTAGDNRVCPICQTLAGRTWSIEEARTGTMEIGPDDVREFVPDEQSVGSFTGEFRVKPPTHPQCRCRLLPEVI